MNKEDTQTSHEGVVRACTAITSIYGIALFVGRYLSFMEFFNEDRIAERTRINNNYNKFTALCAALFGAEVLGGLIWQKATEKKAASLTNRIEQEKLKAPETSASR